MKTRIKFTRKRLKLNLLMGLAWTILAVLQLTTMKGTNWIDYGWIALATLHIGQYIYEYKNQYLTIEKGLIYKSFPFSKKIRLMDIEHIKNFAGDYILKTKMEELSINTEIIEEKSLSELNRILGQLDLPKDKTLFANRVDGSAIK